MSDAIKAIQSPPEGPDAPEFEAPRNLLLEGTETQFQLIWRAFKAHKLATFSLGVLGLLYFVAAFAEFLAPNDPHKINARYTYAPPQAVHFLDQDEDGWHFRPHVTGYKVEVDAVALRRTFVPDQSKKYDLHLFVKSDTVKMWGFIPLERRLFGVQGRREIVMLMGADRLGRDLFSRLIYGARVTLSIGLAGITLSLVLGVVIGGISGYYRGTIDSIIQRIIEFLRSIPAIPLWMGLAASLPRDWSPLRAWTVSAIFGSSCAICCPPSPATLSPRPHWPFPA